MSFRFIITALFLSLLWLSASRAQILGDLVLDGPPTPEQISLYFPILIDTISAVSATVQYRITDGGSWVTGHPLHRIRPAWSDGEVDDAFAGVITGLEPNTNYTVEVSVPVGDGTNVRTLVTTTRALPATAGTPTVTIHAGSNTTQIESIINGLSPGDIVMFEDGTYTIDDLNIGVNGTEESPIYIRGESRDGVILHDSDDEVFRIDDASNIIIENLTILGSQEDSGRNASSEGIRFTGSYVQKRITIRNVTMIGVDKGIITDNYLESILVYDCNLSGNNVWTAPFITTNISWNDDGIRLAGYGNCAFNNT